ncbi:hypothetical protein [Inquilinus limosus]|nr:hypothetical protein [Inquilinus limosus]
MDEYSVTLPWDFKSEAFLSAYDAFLERVAAEEAAECPVVETLPGEDE